VGLFLLKNPLIFAFQNLRIARNKQKKAASELSHMQILTAQKNIPLLQKQKF
jgi:hypothetical protein